MTKQTKFSIEGGNMEWTEDQLVSSTGSSTMAAATRCLTEILSTMIEYQRNPKGDVDKLLADAISSLKAIAPSDEVESLLSTQMVTTHLTAMECLRRAALLDQTFEGRQSALKHAHKFMSLYLRQLDTLDKHRGKGKQKITVEHVNVESGGQAIVGNVNTGTKAPHDPLKNDTGEAMPMVGGTDPEKEPSGHGQEMRTNRKRRKSSK